jgi:outer membrane protein OmpA-like peptidoglycan-associated protein
VLEGVNFDFDKADIRPDAVPILQNNLPEFQCEKIHVTVVGHTDDRGTEEYNQRLSERRAKSVMQYYIEQGIPSSCVSAEGRGKDEPIAVNEPKGPHGDTAEENKYAHSGRALNRRIELHIEDATAKSTP